ncbi:unnamed protein product [Didymodactylos carnosus]|uniref:Ubiquitin-like protease family profile domain-containing protein n=1 Tax=Didymodactylos carnosus TaxID=1234261 RepID=A0A814A8W4_9BILA|nr:unnamed protein product [Didymodactylos carnosus]CAF1312218.1 unnamed protein product [Didymodactylos carnosus]CAF3690339.1 unnamed protein product [Didymodactylos carnosus]CAF4120514.1 unnamed protein product [Didymodactylos carnosus]
MIYNRGGALPFLYRKCATPNIQQEPTAKQAKFDHIEDEIEEQNVMKFNQEQELEQEYDVKSFQEDNEQLPKLQSESEPKEEQAHLLLKEKVIFSYSNLKRYNFKRNKKLDSIHDVYDKTTWLTDFHIYLFFELLHNQFPNINESISPFFRDILPDEEKVLVSFENVQQQIGGNDCGLFALAFATSLCYTDVASLMFYDQIPLRDHYVKCIENNEIQPFPSKPKRGSTKNASKLVDLYLT